MPRASPPFVLVLGPLKLAAHPTFEMLGYLIGFQTYRALRRRHGDALEGERRWWIIAAAVLGAALGSRVVFWFVDPALTWQHHLDWPFLVGGKTIVGGLAGGYLLVELTKRMFGITRRTGDLFALPLAIGMMLGRVGCFLTGLDDHTCGLVATLPWGVDFGDGLLRHPTQLYEIVWLVLLGLWCHWRAQRPMQGGEVFRGFMVGYMAFRLGCEFLKPGVPLGGLTAIQWVCLLVIASFAPALLRARTPRSVSTA